MRRGREAVLYLFPILFQEVWGGSKSPSWFRRGLRGGSRYYKNRLLSCTAIYPLEGNVHETGRLEPPGQLFLSKSQPLVGKLVPGSLPLVTGEIRYQQQPSRNQDPSGLAYDRLRVSRMVKHHVCDHTLHRP